jgi:hypothetical protein
MVALIEATVAKRELETGVNAFIAQAPPLRTASLGD